MGLVLDFDELSVIRERQYADSTTLLAQIGVIKAPVRPVMAGTASAPTIVVASGSDAERANVETFKANMAAFNAHDVKAITAMNAPTRGSKRPRRGVRATTWWQKARSAAPARRRCR